MTLRDRILHRVRLEVGHTDRIADLVGYPRENVVEVLAELKREGLVHLDGELLWRVGPGSGPAREPKEVGPVRRTTSAQRPDLERRIEERIRQNPGLKASELRDLVDVRHQLQHPLERLRAAGRIRMAGRARGATWWPVEQPEEVEDVEPEAVDDGRVASAVGSVDPDEDLADPGPKPPTLPAPLEESEPASPPPPPPSSEGDPDEECRRCGGAGVLTRKYLSGRTEQIGCVWCHGPVEAGDTSETEALLRRVVSLLQDQARVHLDLAARVERLERPVGPVMEPLGIHVEALRERQAVANWLTEVATLHDDPTAAALLRRSANQIRRGAHEPLGGAR